jgi:hypothetical protein
VADVQLDDLGNLRNRQDVFIVEAVAGVHFQTQVCRQRCCIHDRGTLVFATREVRIAICPGMNFDCMSAGSFCALDLLLDRIDEQADVNAATLQRSYRLCHFGLMCDGVQPALGGELFPFLRHEASISRPPSLGKGHHCRGHGHLQINLSFNFGTQLFNVTLLNVPAIFTEVHGYPVGTGLFCKQRRFDRIWMFRAPRLSHRCDVIDVDS